MKPQPTKQLSENLEVLPEVLPVHKDPAGGSIWEKHDEIRGAKFGNVSQCCYVCAETLKHACVTHDCTFCQVEELYNPAAKSFEVSSNRAVIMVIFDLAKRIDIPLHNKRYKTKVVLQTEWLAKRSFYTSSMFALYVTEVQLEIVITWSFLLNETEAGIISNIKIIRCFVVPRFIKRY